MNWSPSRFIQALKREAVDCTPVWVMRQAGRYLPEYRATRARAGSFLKLCQTPELACEVTLQPIARFDLDAAILFSDILTVSMAMGLELDFIQGEGPHFANPVRDQKAIANLGTDVLERLDYVFAAAQLASGALAGKVPLIGFAGSPWTVATYMVEGGSSKDFRHIKAMLYREPVLLAQLLDKLTAVTCAYLGEQVKHGAQALMLFDTWGGVLNPACYQAFSLNYMQQIIRHIQSQYPQVPVILFSKNASEQLAVMARSGAAALGVDWMVDMATARQRVGDQVALQGNLDPCVLYAAPEVIEAEVQKVLASFGKVGAGAGHIFNLGHGIHQYVEPEKLQVMIAAIKKHSPAYHGV